MKKKDKLSKVAICPKCNKIILACHIDYLIEETEEEFTELTNEGFTVKLETIDETQSRDFGSYSQCSTGECLTFNTKKK
jgi:hypothetical protein